MDGVKKWMDLGNEILVSFNRARSHMMAAVDDLVEEGTLSRPHGEAIIEAWKRKAAGDSDRESETAGFTSEGAPSELAALWEKWIQMTPVRREEFEALRERIDRLEKQYSQHSGD